MEAISRIDLETALKDSALAVLNELVKHHIKGVDLIAKGIEHQRAAQEEITLWYEVLKQLILFLKPLFEIVRDWLASAYTHLIAIFDWAKEMYHEIFG